MKCKHGFDVYVCFLCVEEAVEAEEANDGAPALTVKELKERLENVPGHFLVCLGGKYKNRSLRAVVAYHMSQALMLMPYHPDFGDPEK